MKDLIRIQINNNNLISMTKMDDSTLQQVATQISEELRNRKRMAWVAERYKRCDAAERAGEIWLAHKGTTTIIIKHLGYGRTKTALARTAPGDIYRFDVGMAVAWARLNGEEIPDFI